MQYITIQNKHVWLCLICVYLYVSSFYTVTTITATSAEVSAAVTQPSYVPLESQQHLWSRTLICLCAQLCSGGVPLAGSCINIQNLIPCSDIAVSFSIHRPHNPGEVGDTSLSLLSSLVYYCDEVLAAAVPDTHTCNLCVPTAGGHHSASASPSQSAQGSPQRARSASTSPSQAFQPGPLPPAAGPGAPKPSPQLKCVRAEKHGTVKPTLMSAECLLCSLYCAASPSRWPTPSQRRCEEAWPTMRPKPRPSAASDSPSPASSPTKGLPGGFLLPAVVRFERRKKTWPVDLLWSLPPSSEPFLLLPFPSHRLWILTPGATLSRQINDWSITRKANRWELRRGCQTLNGLVCPPDSREVHPQNTTFTQIDECVCFIFAVPSSQDRL